MNNSDQTLNSRLTCSFCGQPRRISKNHKQASPGKCCRFVADEVHWSKLLQTCQVSTASSKSPPVTTPPPVSPLAAFSNSVSKFFKWISPSRKSTRKENEEIAQILTSSPSETSVTAASPKPSTVLPSLDRLQNRQQKASLSQIQTYAAEEPTQHRELARKILPTQLQSPDSSALMAKRRMGNHGAHKHRLVVLSEDISQSDLQLNASLVISSQSISNKSKDSLVSRGHLPLTVAASCPVQQHKPKKLYESKEQLAASWPPHNYHQSYGSEGHVFLSNEVDAIISSSMNIKDFRINYEDIHKDELIGFWRNGCIHKGRWHGEVVIVTYELNDENVSKEFWNDVKTMSRIRHENIALFMGACTDAGKLTLVISECAGTSLFENLHVTRTRLALPMKINIAYQVAQAMAYLHAKKIVYKQMNSRNVFLEGNKAIFSMIDFSTVYKSKDMDKKVMPIPYMAPELLKTLVYKPNNISSRYTFQTDVYAFGILLHELMSGSKPYKDIPTAELIITHVLNARRQLTETLVCPQPIKKLIERCWSELPNERLCAREVLKMLHKKDIILYNRFSSSAPENINKLIAHDSF